MNKSINTPDGSIVVFGFGAQASAQALNLRDSKRPVKVYLRSCSLKKNRVIEEQIPLTQDAALAAKEAGIAALLLPDGEQPAFYKKFLEQNLPRGALLIFAHGFAVHYQQIVPRADLDIVLVAPLAHSATVRSDYVNGKGVPCIIAVAQDATGKAHARAMSYAKSISQAGPFIDSTFKEEVESDIFAEQAVLCGGLPELVRASFDTLVESGYNPDIAYFCCLKELRAIVSVLDAHAIAGLRKKISDTALYGAVTRGQRIVDEDTRKNLKEILEEIKTGKFADELISNKSRVKNILDAAAQKDKAHLLEKIHAKFRGV